MLEVRGLTAGYGGVPVLHGVSLRIDAGRIVGLLGANNAGKTTLINCISGLVPLMAGEIRIDGEDISAVAPSRRVERGLVQVPEGRLVFAQVSVRDNLMLGGINRRARPRRARELERVLGLFPRLKERLAQPAGTLSGGEQQMLAIGRGLMAGARLLMLDEPSLGLAPRVVQQIFEIIDHLHAEGLTILLVEQNLSLTLRRAGHCYVLERGRIVIDGAAERVRDNPGTRAAYLGL
jgi:branched-chain amino acid transport system ATP-binding protein